MLQPFRRTYGHISSAERRNQLHIVLFDEQAVQDDFRPVVQAEDFGQMAHEQFADGSAEHLRMMQAEARLGKGHPQQGVRVLSWWKSRFRREFSRWKMCLVELRKFTLFPLRNRAGGFFLALIFQMAVLQIGDGSQKWHCRRNLMINRKTLRLLAF